MPWTSTTILNFKYGSFRMMTNPYLKNGETREPTVIGVTWVGPYKWPYKGNWDSYPPYI